MKKILITILLIMSILPAAAKTLTGGVVYTVESAREAAFEGIEYEISMEPFKKYMKDPGFIAAANTEGGKPRVSKRGRRVEYFSDGGYAVRYRNNLLLAFYYDKKGVLIAIETGNLQKFPFVSRKYKARGLLIHSILNVSKTEAYMYNADKKLQVHWVDDKCYDADGHIIMYRY